MYIDILILDIKARVMSTFFPFSFFPFTRFSFGLSCYHLLSNAHTSLSRFRVRVIISTFTQTALFRTRRHTVNPVHAPSYILAVKYTLRGSGRGGTSISSYERAYTCVYMCVRVWTYDVCIRRCACDRVVPSKRLGKSCKSATSRFCLLNITWLCLESNSRSMQYANRMQRYCVCLAFR